MKSVKKIFTTLASELHALAWTLAGAVTVLITLSGATRIQGLWISAAALGIHLFGVLWKAFFGEKENENN
jgi:hypothetical protein